MTSTKDSDSILIIAAEDSSALYAQRLLEHWQNQGNSIQAFGIGSKAMEDLGFEILGRSEELAVVGIAEVLVHFNKIKSVFHSVVSEAEKRKPKLALLLDYPGFNLRLAKKLKKLGIPVVYYISPQIWAWRQGRVQTIKKLVDRVLTIFPFENKFYEENGVPVTFVGHPLLDEISKDQRTEKERQVQRQRYGIQESDVVLGLMPGSRRSEIGHHLNTQLEVAQKLHQQHPQLKVILLTAPGIEVDGLKEQTRDCGFPIQYVKDEPFKMIDMTDVILCASGTATMMVGLMKKPMVIMYHMNPITAFLARRLVKHSRYFGMVNLILGFEAVPERFQEEANVDELSRLLSKFINDKDYYQNTVEELSKLENRLGDPGANQRVAQAVAEYFA